MGERTTRQAWALGARRAALAPMLPLAAVVLGAGVLGPAAASYAGSSAGGSGDATALVAAPAEASGTGPARDTFDPTARAAVALVLVSLFVGTRVRVRSSR